MTQPAITDLTAAILDHPTPCVVFTWHSTGAAYCRITGDDSKQPPVRAGSEALCVPLSRAQPLRSRYVLEAIGDDDATATRTLDVAYAFNTTVPPVVLDSGVAVRCTPDARQVLVLGADGITAFDARTLQPIQARPLVPDDGTGVDAFAIAPDGTALYVISFGGRVFAYDLPAFTPQSPAGTHAVRDSEPPYHLAANPDRRTLTLVTNQTERDGRLVGTNQLLILDRQTLAPVAPSPVATGHTMIHRVGQHSGRQYLGEPEGVRVLERHALDEAFAPVALELPGMLALAPDEAFMYTVSFNAATRSFMLSRIVAATGEIDADTPIAVGFNPLFMALLGVAFAGIATSADGALLFVLGGEPAALQRREIRSTLHAYDASRLVEYPWSPLDFGTIGHPIAFDVSPDGSRLFMVVGERIGAGDSTTALVVADARFVEA